MVRFRVVLALLVLGVGACAPRFESQRLAQHIRYLASDELQGRAAGSPGCDLAASYIANQFREIGLSHAGENGSWFHTVELLQRQELTGRPELNIEGAIALGRLWRDFVTLPCSSGESFDGPLAFLGYGITDEGRGYDDFEGINAAGKVLLMFRHEPASFGDGSQDEPILSYHGYYRQKAFNAVSHNAAAILIVDRKPKPGQSDALFRFDRAARTRGFGIPMMQVTRAFANRLLTASGVDDLDTLQQRIDEDLTSASVNLHGLRARGCPGIVRPVKNTYNVVASLPGRGSQSEEIIVVGAHYDHLGTQLPSGGILGKTQWTRPEVYNGADDNASGVAGMLEIARAFALNRSNRRRLLFIAFTAEEMGLVGSREYCDRPTVPLNKVVAMINLDMIGRLKQDRLYLFGVATAREFRPMVEPMAADLGFNMVYGSSGFGASDHASFYMHGIPVMLFFTGLHGDYHCPTDEFDKLNLEGVARVTEFAYRTIERIARTDEPPSLTRRDTWAPRIADVYLGIQVGEPDGEPGVVVNMVAGNSPADQAGINANDRLLAVDDRDISDENGLLETLQRYEPEDTAVLTILRDGKRLRLDVAFDAR